MDIMNKDLCSLKEMKEAIPDANKKFRMKRCGEKAPMNHSMIAIIV